ncbi:hypothetical protein NMG60_11029989 [Bertholletia excelsa]
MKAFLRAAEAAEEINNDPQLITWMVQVRNVAYDTEDALDEFMPRFGHNHGKGIYGFLHKIACGIKTLRARHRLASQVQSIKSRVNHIAETRKRYRENFSIAEQGSSSSSLDYRDNALLLQEAQLVGIDKPKKQLIDLLVDEYLELKVISLTGMGGVGKTTLAKAVYDDTTVKTHFQSHVWITVSEKFKIDELLKDMIKQLYKDAEKQNNTMLDYGEAKKKDHPELDTMNLNNLRMEITTFLKQKKYVVFLDDVWNIEDWELFKSAFPDCMSGSRVLITTRKKTVALSRCAVVRELKPLPPKESWILFCNKAFGVKSCPKHVEEISRKIWERCGGLPLALVVVGGLLSTKDLDNINEWERMNRNFTAELEEDDRVKSINRILSLSYIELPCHLKLCFMYLSIFPEDYLIDHWQLIRLWVAEGFVTAEGKLTLEEVAEGYLKQLVGRSLIQVAVWRSDGRVKFYSIHDLWREIILKKAMENNIVTIVKEKQRILSDNVRRLSIQNDLENVTEWDDLNRLRSLLMFAKTNSISNQQMLEALFRHLRLVKVLDLRDLPLEILPNEIVKAQHLRYLCLRATKISMLPKSIGELQNLETLDLK